MLLSLLPQFDLSSAKAVVLADNTWSSAALLPHSVCNGFSLIFYVQRFVKMGKMSYTEVMANRNLLNLFSIARPMIAVWFE